MRPAAIILCFRFQTPDYRYTSLQEVDISSLSPKNFDYCHQMFTYCESLETIYAAKDFFLDSVTVTSDSDMFTGCLNLKGGNGTVYDADHTDSAYARIDSADKPGYFTAKP